MSHNHDHENEVTYFAKTNFRNSMVKFGIKTDDRRRHVYVIGKTGMGKTTLLENLILSDIYAGHGCCYVDPHGDTAEKLLDYIPSSRINDVVYFNPSDVEFPIGFNILEAVSERHKHLVASGMMGVFKKIWENMWSSRMEYILNNTILALLDNPGQTLLGINRLLSDPEFRSRMIGNVSDPVVRQFWLKEFASYNDKYAQEAVAPIQNKIGQFLSASVIRNMVAQVKSTINIRQIMDEGKIFIVNLSKGRIGEDNSRLLGGLLITKLQLSAMERVDMPEKERVDFYLYVDEFQNFAVESFAGILSEARKYRLCLTMAHQYIAQLTDEVREAVFGNVGTIISYRVGSPDAVYMEKEFAPRFLPEDIINLPKYNVYLKLLIDGVTSQPFSAITLPPISQRTGSEERVIRVSRERYANPRAEIEDKILKWSGMENQDMATMLKEAEDKKKASKDSKKPKFEYNCSRCNKDMVLPVELDKSRPIYCEDCIDIVRDERKKGIKPKPMDRPPVSSAPVRPSEGQPIVQPAVKESMSLDSLKTPIPPKIGALEPSESAPEPVTVAQPVVPDPKPEPAQTEPEMVKPIVETPMVEPVVSQPVVPIPSKPVVEKPSVPVQPIQRQEPEQVISLSSLQRPQQTGSSPVRSGSTVARPIIQTPSERSTQDRREEPKSSTSSAPSSVAQNGDPEKKRKRKRKKKTPADTRLSATTPGTVSSSVRSTGSSPVSSSSQPERSTPVAAVVPEAKPVQSVSMPISKPEPIPPKPVESRKPAQPTSGTIRSGQSIKFE